MALISGVVASAELALDRHGHEIQTQLPVESIGGDLMLVSSYRPYGVFEKRASAAG
jgi:hypothetical protein